MKTLRHLEKKRYIWFLISISALFFILRLPSLIEPYWYGDEGIYQVISLALQNGRDLYSGLWDNKPPMLYLLYALFSGDQFTLRFLSLLTAIYTTIVFFFLSSKLYKNLKIAGITTTFFALLFATPYLEGNIANAENFMLPLTVTAGFIIYSLTETAELVKQRKRRLLFFAGFLLGLAFLFKIVAIFDFAAFLVFLLLLSSIQRNTGKTFQFRKEIYAIKEWSKESGKSLLSGFLLPVCIPFLYYAITGNLMPFIQAAFFGNIGYVNYGNTFIIPQGLLILKVIAFITTLTFIYRYRKSFTKPTMFITVWFLFALFSAFFSQRPYTHYLLVLLPSFCLLSGLLFVKRAWKVKTVIALPLLFVIVIAVTYFPVFGIKRTLQYYQNTVQFLTGEKHVEAYQAFFDPETPRDYDLVTFIKNHTTQSDQIFLWGDSPQIYYLTQKLPPGRYSVAYHIIESKGGVDETQAVIDKTKPKFIITLSEAPPIPFYLPSYVGKYSLKGATIYERSF